MQGICGNKFQTPFAKPAGIGKSSAIVNVLWGFFNVVVAAGLVRYFFAAPPRPVGIVLATALGIVVMASWLAIHFSKVRKSAPHP